METTPSETHAEPADVTRPVAGYANYNGDQRQILADGAKGPTLDGLACFPVTAEYDPETNRTRVGFSHYPPEAGS